MDTNSVVLQGFGRSVGADPAVARLGETAALLGQDIWITRSAGWTTVAL